MENEITIPIIVDDVKALESFKMTRLIYFSIGATEFFSDFLIEFENIELPVTVIDFHGIITRSIDETRFSTPESIGKLFDTIEDTEGLYVDTNDIWLPNELFPQIMKRGDLVRISTALFKLALAYRSDKLSYNDFLSGSLELKSEIYKSPDEDKAFKKWSSEQIEYAIERYNKSPVKNRLKFQERK